ncbi:MAG: peptidylprolyl isomerase [Methanoregula sp.]|jgi:peptidylprolyl isomerase
MTALRVLLAAGCIIIALLMCAGCTQSAKDATAATPVVTATAGTTRTAVTSPGIIAAQKLVLLETNMGTITIALDPDMPVTAGNFESLVKRGYYDGVTFHRVVDGFMIQSGDPTGTGRGGPGYTIKDEFTPTNANNRGTVAMANIGVPDTGGSQFFINLVNNNYLDTKHPVFGKVVEGMDVVDAIGKVATDANYRPLQNVTIVRAVMV